jgi:hypothetical protein
MQPNVIETIMTRVKNLSVDQQEQVLEFVETLDVSRKSIWDKLEERLDLVPQEEFADLPADASLNIDHYLYGAPKK